MLDPWRTPRPQMSTPEISKAHTGETTVKKAGFLRFIPFSDIVGPWGSLPALSGTNVKTNGASVSAGLTFISQSRFSKQTLTKLRTNERITGRLDSSQPAKCKTTFLSWCGLRAEEYNA